MPWRGWFRCGRRCGRGKGRVRAEWCANSDQKRGNRLTTAHQRAFHSIFCTLSSSAQARIGVVAQGPAAARAGGQSSEPRDQAGVAAAPGAVRARLAQPAWVDPGGAGIEGVLHGDPVGARQVQWRRPDVVHQSQTAAGAGQGRDAVARVHRSDPGKHSARCGNDWTHTAMVVGTTATTLANFSNICVFSCHDHPSEFSPHCSSA